MIGTISDFVPPQTIYASQVLILQLGALGGWCDGKKHLHLMGLDLTTTSGGGGGGKE